MKTNEHAQQVLQLVHEMSGELLKASRDGKIDTGELLGIMLNAAPMLMKLTGTKDQSGK